MINLMNFIISIFLTCYQPTAKPITVNPMKSKLLASLTEIKDCSPKSVLIIGDSQSAIQTASGKKITWTWPNIVEKKLTPNWQMTVVALGGKTTNWMLEASKDELKKKWDMVIIYGGGNDASNSSIPLDTTISNFQKLIDMANSGGAEVWVNLGWKIEGKFMDINILPVGRPANLLKRRSDWIPYIQKRKDLQVLLGERLTGCQFVQPYDLQSKTSDGIHPTEEGHRIVSDIILSTIFKINL
jgi:lysophospholipase L1-like esterase